MASQSFLSLDIGTTLVKAAIISEHSKIISEAQQKIDIIRVNTNQVEQSPEQVLTACDSVLAEVLSSNSSIKYAAIVCQRSSVLAWDKSSGKAISPILSWQDTRATKLVYKLSSKKNDIKAQSGLVLSEHYAASKLQWLKDNCEFNESTTSLSPLVSFLLFHLLKEPPIVVDQSIAARLGLLNIQTAKWDPLLLKLFDLPESVLPKVLPVQHFYGTLKKQSIPVTAVCGDQLAAYHSVQPSEQSVPFINAGTGAFIQTYINTQQALVTKKDLLLALGNNKNNQTQYLLEGTVHGAGAALDWAKNKLAIESCKDLHLWTQGKITPPVFINTVGGLGSPYWRNEIEPQFIQLNEDNNIPKLKMIAVAESIVFLITYNLACMAQKNKPWSHVILAGGLSRYTWLAQWLADLMQLPVHQLTQPQATCIGAAHLAGLPYDTSKQNLKIYAPSDTINNILTCRYKTFLFHMEKANKCLK